MKEAFHKMIELRRSVRRFKPEPVDFNILAKLMTLYSIKKTFKTI